MTALAVPRADDALRSPAPALGGWRGRDGYLLLSHVLQQHSRFKIVPEVDSPLKWVAHHLCSGTTARDCKLPLYCSVCGDRPPAASIANLLNTRNGNPYSCACSCVYRPNHATAKGHARLAAIAEASQCTLVVPAEEWVARHLSKSTLWQLVEVRCSLCGKHRQISNQNILKNPTLKPQCPCRPPPKRTRVSKKQKQAMAAAATDAQRGRNEGEGEAAVGADADADADADAEATRRAPCRQLPSTPAPPVPPPPPPPPTTTKKKKPAPKPRAAAQPPVASSPGSSGPLGPHTAGPTAAPSAPSIETKATKKRPRSRRWSDSEMSSEEEDEDDEDDEEDDDDE